MEKKFNNIEDLFKASFDDYKLEPSDKVWSNINFRLKFKKFVSSKFFVGSLLVGSIVVALMLNFNKSERNIIPQAQNKLQNDTHIIDESNKKNQDEKNQNWQSLIIKNSKTDRQGKIAINNKIIEPLNNRTKDLAPIIISKSIKILTVNNIDSINLNSVPVPRPVFSVESTDGCVPFELKINNLSKFAYAFEWDFGDGHKSKEAAPIYTFRYPGVYKLELKAIGIGGIAVSFIDSIVVHESPVARMEWPYESEIQTGQKIIIPNESENVSFAQWTYGDKCVSNTITGRHTFEKEGEYSIMLKVWSENNCSDSAIINNVKVVNSIGKIVFPNAFTPNLDGPSSGYYGRDDYHNDVFHPKTNAKIEKYEIRIYSKAGGEVFRSNEFSYGWNGYYQNHLLPEGVYLYIVSGEFEGGTKFYKKGNLTLLHKR